MSTFLGDYNRLLVIAIWLFFASGLLVLKTPGSGVAYLGPGKTRLRFPSWRAAFGRRLAMVVSPIHVFWPMAEVELLAESRDGAMAELAASAQQIARPMRGARPFLFAVTAIVVLVIPAWVMLRGADITFLALAAIAYVLYLLGVVVLWFAANHGDRERLRGQWKSLLEPLFCLPYGGHLCRKLSERYNLSVPLVDVLRSEVVLASEDLHSLLMHINDVVDMTDDADKLHFLANLRTLVDARLAGYLE